MFAHATNSATSLQDVVIRPRHALLVGLAILLFITGWFFGTRRHTQTLALQRGFVTRAFPPAKSPALVSVLFQSGSQGYQAVVEIQVESEFGTGYRTTELGRVNSVTEAIEKWALIDWRADGLHIGKDTNKFFLPKSELESGGR